jgi:uncharacterized membrane protein YfcA
MNWLPPLSPLGWVFAVLCGVLVGFTKTGVPGMGILAVPMMAAIFPAGQSTGVFLIMLIAGDLLAVFYYHLHAKWAYVLKPLVWAALGIVLAFAVIRYGRLSDTAIRRMIGIIVLAVLALGLVLKHHKHAVDVPNTWWFVAVIGIVGGFATMTANAAGPIWIVYLLALRFPKMEFLGTNAWVFLILNVFKVPFSHRLGFITPDGLLFDLCIMPAVAVGAFVGVRTARVIPQQSFERAASLLAAAAAIKLLL